MTLDFRGCVKWILISSLLFTMLYIHYPRFREGVDNDCNNDNCKKWVKDENSTGYPPGWENNIPSTATCNKGDSGAWRRCGGTGSGGTDSGGTGDTKEWIVAPDLPVDTNYCSNLVEYKDTDAHKKSDLLDIGTIDNCTGKTGSLGVLKSEWAEF